MNQKLREKTREAFSSVIPITLIVFLLSITIVPLQTNIIMMFLFGSVFLIIGMGFFSLGADMAMMPMGENIGVSLTKSKKLWLIVAVYFIMGLIITIAEPDLQVLANQVPSIPNMVLIITVACGVGIFLVIAVLRILFKIKLAHLLIGFYILIFAIAAVAPENFIPVAFDSGGVTTGPITVPFIMAIGVGLASIRGDKDSQDDSFGLVALCSIGPILAVLILGICYNPQDATYTHVYIENIETMQDVVHAFMVELPEYLKEVGLAVAPIILFFIIYQIISRRFRKKSLVKMCIGFLYTLIGLVLFLTGVNVGFIPVGHLLGSELAATSHPWILIPIGIVIGYYIVAAEPAVHVLNKQVAEVTGGAISQKAMGYSLSIGVAASLALSMIRILTGISIFWFLIPGYLLALGLTFVVPKIFTGIAFDSGGVASGPMTSTFLLPFAMGACESLGGNVLTDAFGVIAMVAMTPLITIQIMGLIYKYKMKAASAIKSIDTDNEDDIIEYSDDLEYEEDIPNE